MEKVMLERIGQAAMYEQLAEECTELAQAALKAARQLRGDNPPRMTPKDVYSHLIEEVSDVMMCLEELGLEADEDTIEFKRARFLRGWREIHPEEEDAAGAVPEWFYE